MAAGFGHGTYLLFALFLGPAYFIPLAIFGLPVLYGFYALGALRAQQKQRYLTMAGVVIAHWLGVSSAAWYVMLDELGLTYLEKVWPHYSVIICLGLAVFLASHLMFFYRREARSAGRD